MALIKAHITKVEQEIGSEWGTIHTDHDSVKKLSTKRPDALREAAEFRTSGDLVEIDYAERSKRTDDGRTFRNYYYNHAGSIQTNGASATGIDMIQPKSGGAEDPDRSWRICLQTGGKLAVATLPLMPVEQRDFETQKTIAQAWAEFFYFSQRPEARRVKLDDLNTVAARPGAYSEPVHDGPPPYTDDEIPF